MKTRLLLELVLKEFKLELRRKSVISGIGLYLLSLSFICYLAFSLQRAVISAAAWSALFWLTILFSVINSMAKTFIGEKKGIDIYFYSIASPQLIILSKIIYNAFLGIALTSVGFLLFLTFLGGSMQDKATFFSALVLTSIGFSSALSLISGIASKTNNSHVLMAVLSFPVVLSVLLLAIKITKNALDGLDPSASADELINLGAINFISTALAYLLFPYIWRS